MKFGVIVFPGSNCDHDAYHVISKHVGQPVDFIWHRETDLSTYDAVILPGGFSYGDYLRAGALARPPGGARSRQQIACRARRVSSVASCAVFWQESHEAAWSLVDRSPTR